MSRIDEIKELVKQEREAPLMRLRWSDIAVYMIGNGYTTVNQIVRAIEIDRYQRQRLVVALARLKYIGRVRRHGIWGYPVYELSEKAIRHYKQRGLDEFWNN
jgi:hypothetical protein